MDSSPTLSESTDTQCRRLDWMCVDIEKDSETEDEAHYFFTTTIWDKDPRFASRSMFVGVTRGLLAIRKESGEIALLHPMREDDNEKIFRRACQKIGQHWKSGELPDRTSYICG